MCMDFWVLPMISFVFMFRVWGKPEICLIYVSRKSLELIIVHKKCLENFRVSFGDFRNEKRKAEKWGKCSS